MNYLSQISFFFGAIGAFNGLVVALFLLFNKSYSKLQNRLFGIFLFVLSVRVIHSLFYAFSSNDYTWPIQSGPTYFLLIAPLLFSYTVSVLEPISFWIKNWKYHILFWIVIVVSLMVLFPFKKYIVFNKETLLPIIYIQWLIFILGSIYFAAKSIKDRKNITTKIKWVIFLLVVNLIIWMSFALIKFNYFIIGSILFSVFFYLCFLFFLLQKKTAAKIFTKTKLKKIIIPDEESRLQIQKLESLMTSEKLFTNPNLKLAEVAERINIPTHILTKIINDNLGKNFTDFINDYRIKEAKKLIGNNSVYTIEAIGNQCGFNSKSAFYKAFKKITNTTPAKFKSRL